MTCSVIVPCHPRNRGTLGAMLASIDAASRGLDVEPIVIEDVESRGLSWARNQGLDRATGDVVFFCDADDTVKPEYFRHHLAALEATSADFVLSSLDYAPLKRAYDLSGNAAIRSVLLPAFFGYALDDVRRWNAGGSLLARRDQGSVCRGAFRRNFLSRYNIRFDERLFLYEDSPFIAECAARAERVTSIAEVLYNYVPGANGILATSHGTRRYYDYKFAALANRKAIAARVGGNALDYFKGSAVFTTLELLRARQDWRAYARDEFVRRAIREFPLSVRHPLVAAGVLFLRTIS